MNCNTVSELYLFRLILSVAWPSSCLVVLETQNFELVMVYYASLGTFADLLSVLCLNVHKLFILIGNG